MFLELHDRGTTEHPREFLRVFPVSESYFESNLLCPGCQTIQEHLDTTSLRCK